MLQPDNMFVDNWNQWAIEARRNSIKTGEWRNESPNQEFIFRTLPTLLTAFCSISRGNLVDEKIPDYTIAETALAKIVIQIMEYGQAGDLKIARAIEAIIELDANTIISQLKNET